MRLVMTLLATTAFQTAQPAPKVDWLAQFTPAAITYWGNGQLPACGRQRYDWAKAIDPEEKAHADLATCTIVLNTDYWPQFLANPGWMCVLILHETGHLYGHQHSEGGVMAGGDTPEATANYANYRSFPPCASVDRLQTPARNATTRSARRATIRQAR